MPGPAAGRIPCATDLSVASGSARQFARRLATATGADRVAARCWRSAPRSRPLPPDPA
jgi:hypothetical protein